MFMAAVNAIHVSVYFAFRTGLVDMVDLFTFFWDGTKTPAFVPYTNWYPGEPSSIHNDAFIYYLIAFLFLAVIGMSSVNHTEVGLVFLQTR